MQKYPGGGYKEHFYAEEAVEDFSFKDDLHYNKGSGFQMKPYPEQPKHNYYNNHNNNNIHGYEYDNYCNGFKKGHDGYTIQHTEARYETEEYTEPWNGRNDYPGHGGKHHMNALKYESNVPHGHFGVMGAGHAGGGYGGHHGNHHGNHHHQYYGEEKPHWNSKAIMD